MKEALAMGEVLHKEKKGYTKALVIFIDILGSQSRDDFEELYEINELFHSELLENEKQDREYIAYQRHIYTFSDCAYLIYDYRDKSENDWGKLFNVALLNCEPLLMKFLSRELIFRGGVAFGSVYYDTNKNMFFGNAVNKAYQYESTVAKVPRIVVDEYVANQIYLLYSEKKKCIVQQDSDGKFFLNYFKSLQEGIDYSPITQKTNEQFINDLIRLCENRILAFFNNDNVRLKYEWLKTYSEKSKNYNIIGKIEYKKPLWDRIINGILKRDKSKDFEKHMFTNYDVELSSAYENFMKFNVDKPMMLRNVGSSFDDLEHRKHFEEFLDKDIVQSIMEMDDDSDK